MSVYRAYCSPEYVLDFEIKEENAYRQKSNIDAYGRRTEVAGEIFAIVCNGRVRKWKRGICLVAAIDPRARVICRGKKKPNRLRTAAIFTRRVGGSGSRVGGHYPRRHPWPSSLVVRRSVGARVPFSFTIARTRVPSHSLLSLTRVGNRSGPCRRGDKKKKKNTIHTRAPTFEKSDDLATTLSLVCFPLRFRPRPAAAISPEINWTKRARASINIYMYRAGKFRDRDKSRERDRSRRNYLGLYACITNRLAAYVLRLIDAHGPGLPPPK